MKTIRTTATVAMLCLIATIFSFSSIQAQTTSIGFSAEMGAPQFASQTMAIDILPSVEIPLNFVDFGEATNMGYGVSAHLKHTFANERAAIMGRVGYLNFEVADQGLIEANTKIIPVMLGARYYIFDGLYAGAEIGASRVVSKVSATFLINLSKTSPETIFSFAPRIGYELDLGKTKLDLGAQYNLIGGKYNYLGVSAGINLPFQR